MSTRRQFLAAATGLGAAMAAPALAQARPRVVVVGAGAGGASVVRALVAATGDAVDVTLVEPQRAHVTCFYSNLWLGGLRGLDSITHDLEAIAALPGVTLARGRAEGIDRDAREVRLPSGTAIPYDLAVLSPGIALDYGSVPGWSKAAEEAMPHAWIAGPQTQLLKHQIDAVPEGGLVVIIAPPDPYRCPPGPYERVSMIAHALTAAGKTGARIIVLDAKDRFSKQPLFQQGWERHYPGMVEWQPPAIHGGIHGVDPASMSVETGFETIEGADLVNVIPRQTAGGIAVDAGLAGKNGFCPIDPYTMKSAEDDRILVLGDASIAGDMPKSAFSAHSQAQVVARTIAAQLAGAARQESVYANRCWSLIGPGDSVYVGGSYRATAEKIAQTESVISTLEDTPDTRRQNSMDAEGWYDGLTRHLYG